ncbi:hypothetical protein BU23DRAFT_565213 [Bimuria novae-zelandiae CBS 107.79]|uniref:RING-type domain-containing protein n=1 Tax=Bimuria novae-zelandiae CBS 107.79 TaxID=1447943 RepID=A0A6A5VKS7_9PLEO|nr:hypothetical protein BU23DRAFT_565213 [Bimuria novae-zelandiae CBS 107.79]
MAAQTESHPATASLYFPNSFLARLANGNASWLPTFQRWGSAPMASHVTIRFTFYRQTLLKDPHPVEYSGAHPFVAVTKGDGHWQIKAGERRWLERNPVGQHDLFGRNVTRISVGTTNRLFFVHEDLLCARSSYFRGYLQARRKQIEGDCSICLDDMRTGGKDLTYCSSCGNNFHFGCIEDWQKQQFRTDRCPLCRRKWKNILRDTTHAFLELAEEDFEKYREWLYSGTITSNCTDINEDFKPWVSAYLLSLKIQDCKFGTAVLHAMLEMYQDNQVYPDQDAIALAYNADAAGDQLDGLYRLRRFLVDTYVAVAKAFWFEDEDWTTYPHEFLRDLAVAMFSKHPGKNNWKLETWKANLDAEE